MTSRAIKILKTAALALCLALAGLATCIAVRWMFTLRDPQNLADFQQFISSLGFGGWLVLLSIQFIQIVIAFIPGGPIQIVAGALFGPVGGLATCVLGMLLATSAVFALVKRYGHRVIAVFVREKEIRQYKFLRDANRLELLVTVLFLIPGTPKDVLTYLFALTPISMSRFMLLSTAARIPAALTSVLAGDSIAGGEWLKAVIYFVIIAVISLGGLFLHRVVMARYKRRKTSYETPASGSHELSERPHPCRKSQRAATEGASGSTGRKAGACHTNISGRCKKREEKT